MASILDLEAALNDAVKISTSYFVYTRLISINESGFVILDKFFDTPNIVLKNSKIVMCVSAICFFF